MTKPHFNTISSSSSHEIQESMSKGQNCLPEPNHSSAPHGSQASWDGTGVAGLSLRTTRSSGQQAATVLWPILMIPLSPHTKGKLDHNLYQNLL